MTATYNLPSQAWKTEKEHCCEGAHAQEIGKVRNPQGIHAVLVRFY